MSFYNLEITVVCSIFSASSKPCITSAMMRVAKINPELNASHSVMQDSSLVQSLIFSNICFFQNDFRQIYFIREFVA